MSLKAAMASTRMIRKRASLMESICDPAKPRTLRFSTNWIHSICFKSHIRVFYLPGFKSSQRLTIQQSQHHIDSGHAPPLTIDVCYSRSWLAA